MAAPKRRAELDSPEGIEEDLHFARDASGIGRGREEQLRATVAAVTAADLTKPDSAILAARDLLTAHVARSCRTLAAKTDDPCAIAAAQSTRDTLVRPPDVTDKVSSIRRRALQTYGCHLSIDGLRKREDLIIRDVAKEVWADLKARREGLGPQTPEQVILPMLGTVRGARDNLFELLLRLYPQETAHFTDATGHLLGEVLYQVAELQWLARTYLAVLRRPGGGTMPSDVFFANFTQAFLYLPFSSDGDRSAIAEAFSDHWRSSKEFMNGLMERDDAEDLTDHWLEWLASCHETCAYHRTRTIGLMCQPHQFTTLLEQFDEFARDLIAGDLTRDMSEDFGILTIPEFVKDYEGRNGEP